MPKHLTEYIPSSNDDRADPVQVMEELEQLYEFHPDDAKVYHTKEQRFAIYATPETKVLCPCCNQLMKLASVASHPRSCKYAKYLMNVQGHVNLNTLFKGHHLGICPIGAPLSCNEVAGMLHLQSLRYEDPEQYEEFISSQRTSTARGNVQCKPFHHQDVFQRFELPVAGRPPNQIQFGGGGDKLASPLTQSITASMSHTAKAMAPPSCRLIRHEEEADPPMTLDDIEREELRAVSWLQQGKMNNESYLSIMNALMKKKESIGQRKDDKAYEYNDDNSISSLGSKLPKDVPVPPVSCQVTACISQVTARSSQVTAHSSQPGAAIAGSGGNETGDTKAAPDSTTNKAPGATGKPPHPKPTKGKPTKEKPTKESKKRKAEEPQQPAGTPNRPIRTRNPPQKYT